MGMTTVRELGPYAGLGHRFVVRCAHPEMAAYLDRALATLACEDHPEPSSGAAESAWICYEVTGDDERFAVTAAGESLTASASARRAVAVLLWHVNRRAIDSAVTDHVVLHAAAVARGGQALVLPAEMEAGKTTLAAGLIDRGWAYLTDEAAALALHRARVRAYPKPLSIDPGSQEVLAHWAPPAGDHIPSSLTSGQWQVPVTARPGGSVAAEAEVAAFVLPRYAAQADTTLTPLTRASAMARIAECAFAWRGDPVRERFAALAAAVRRSVCAELVIGELDEACDAIEAFWETRP